MSSFALILMIVLLIESKHNKCRLMETCFKWQDMKARGGGIIGGKIYEHFMGVETYTIFVIPTVVVSEYWTFLDYQYSNSRKSWSQWVALI